MELLIGAGIGIALVCGVIWLKGRSDDKALNMALVMAHEEARARLAPEDMARLEAQLAELVTESRIAHRQGLPAMHASRMGKRAAIQSIAAFMEIDRMWPT